MEKRVSPWVPDSNSISIYVRKPDESFISSDEVDTHILEGTPIPLFIPKEGMEKYDARTDSYYYIYSPVNSVYYWLPLYEGQEGYIDHILLSSIEDTGIVLTETLERHVFHGNAIRSNIGFISEETKTDFNSDEDYITTLNSIYRHQNNYLKNPDVDGSYLRITFSESLRPYQNEIDITIKPAISRSYLPVSNDLNPEEVRQLLLEGRDIPIKMSIDSNGDVENRMYFQITVPKNFAGEGNIQMVLLDSIEDDFAHQLDKPGSTYVQQLHTLLVGLIKLFENNKKHTLS